jgi:histone deacetylase complex regulatory component SIN3
VVGALSIFLFSSAVTGSETTVATTDVTGEQDRSAGAPEGDENAGTVAAASVDAAQPEQAAAVPATEGADAAAVATDITTIESVSDELSTNNAQAPANNAEAAGTDAAAHTLPSRQLKVEDALAYLDKVRVQFGESGENSVYDQFLEIMKDFRARTIDTPGVIAKVKQLFSGHKELILGFNTFLPPGYRIDEEDIEPVEYVRALKYVTKIKTRFASQPIFYKFFIDILQKYQERERIREKEREEAAAMGGPASHREMTLREKEREADIRDVYQKVAKLFHEQQDLLEEFTHFLPEARNAEVALREERRLAGMRGNGAGGSGAGGGYYPGGRNSSSRQKSGGGNKGGAKGMAGNAGGNGRSRLGSAGAGGVLRGSAGVGGMKGSGGGRREDSPIAAEELQFFHHVKSRLNNPALYAEFLKCLQLFCDDIFTRSELVLLVRDLLGRYPDLFDEFKAILNYKESVEDDRLRERMLQMGALDGKGSRGGEGGQGGSGGAGEVDWNLSKRLGPSYRSLPRGAKRSHTSGRTPQDQLVLNDRWISRDGSEEGAVKRVHKNAFEEFMFRCEDQRFELDIIIESNRSATRVLEGLGVKIGGMSENEWREEFNRSLSAIHLKAVERIYGERSGEVMEQLRRNPSLCLPLIVRRLKQKDLEWSQCLKEWNRVWREGHNRNYYRSLDHQSINFKTIDRKRISAKVLLGDIKQVKSMTLKFESECIFEHLESMIVFVADQTFDFETKEKVVAFLREFIRPFFMYGAQYANEAFNIAPEEQVSSSTTSSKDKESDKDREGSSGLQKKLTSKKGQQGGSRALKRVPPLLFFGNNAFYTFFRLYQIAYSRLARAEFLSASRKVTAVNPLATLTDPVAVAEDGGAVPMDHDGAAGEEGGPSGHEGGAGVGASGTGGVASLPVGRRLPKRGAAASEAAAEEKEGEGADFQSDPTDPSPALDPFNTFLDLLYSLIDGSIDQAKYEDEIRSLFGMTSYILSTMDKVLYQLVKQIESVFSCASCSQLLTLFMYERQRSPSFSESAYQQNCLSKLMEEPCYRFSLSMNTRDLQIVLIDSNLAFKDAKTIEERWSDYVEGYIQGDGADLDVRKHRIFLTRNLLSAPGSSKPSKISGANANSKYKDPLDGVDVVNGLECKICISSYKLFYVENTEDYFYRRGALKRASQGLHFNKEERSKKLSALLSRTPKADSA